MLRRTDKETHYQHISLKKVRIKLRISSVFEKF